MKSLIYSKRIIVFIWWALSASNVCAQLQADFNATPTSGCAPITVQFADLSKGNPTAWKWDLGNGTIVSYTQSNIQPVSAIYITPGQYTIKLTVYNGNDSNTVVKNNFISAFAGPAVLFDVSPVSGCFPLTATFKDNSASGSGSITSWQWDFGDGNVSNSQNPTHIYINKGTFNVSLTVRNSNGCSQTLNKPNLVHIDDGVKANFTNTFPAVCDAPPTAVSFTSTSTGNISNYSWTFGDGGASSGPLLSSTNYAYSNVGIYTVRLVVSNNAGCTDTITKQSLISIGIVKADFTMPDTACVQNPFSIINTSSTLSSVQNSFWTFGDGTTANTINPVKTYSNPGKFSIKLVADYGACKDSITKSIQIVVKPTVNFTANTTANCQPPLDVTFTNQSTGGVTYKWYFGDGDSSSAQNPVHRYNSLGNFTVKLIVTNSNGCIDSIVKPAFINISPPKIIGISPLPVEGCVPQNVNFQPNIQSVDPVIQYEWDFGDASPIFTTASLTTNHSYGIDGIYTVKLKITTKGGCTDSLTVPAAVSVGNKPTALFMASPLVVCAQDPVQFTDTSMGVPTRWLWEFGDGTTSGEQNPLHQYSDTGFFTVRLTVWRHGCQSSVITKVNYVYIKAPIAAFKDSFDCSNQFQHFFTDQSIAPLTWKWHFGDGDSSSLQNPPPHLYKDTGNYTVTLEVTNNGCRYLTTQQFRVLNETADYTVKDSSACAYASAKFNALSHPWNISNYLWNFGDGNQLNGAPPQIEHQYATSGTYNTSLTITDLNGCTLSSTKPINIIKYGPKANFGPDQSVCVNTSVTFADLSVSDGIKNIIKWTWDFGDGNIQVSGAAPFIHTYTSGGVYSVKLVVQDENGCADSITKINNIQVNAPKADFNFSDTLKCKNTAIQFNQSSTGNIAFYNWDFGDNTTDNTSDPLHIYNAENDYSVKLKITDNIGCTDSIIKSQIIHIHDARAIFSMNDTFSSCPPLVVSFNNQSINSIQNNWDFGDGNTSSLTNPSHTYTFAGKFKIQLAVVGNGGCTDTAYKEVEILGPRGTFTYTPLIGCTPLTVSFNASAINTDKYTFDFNNGITSVGKNPTAIYSYTKLGTYLPKMILEDALGCKVPVQGVDSIMVKGVETYIKPLPTYVMCDSATISLTDSTVTNDVINNYNWSFGDGNTSSVINPVHTYNLPGAYKVKLTVTTNSGCTGLDSLNTQIRIIPSPQINIDGDTAGCMPKTVTYLGVLLNPDTSAVNWTWDFANGQGSNVQTPSSQLYPNPGVYTIRLVAVNSSGCRDTSFKTLTVHTLPNVDAGPGNYICRDQSYTLTPSGATSYQWQVNSSLSCLNCNNPIATPDSTVLYHVVGTDNNGCQAADSVLVKVKQRFTMNADPGNTICVGQAVQLRANGAENYTWIPARFLNNNTIANPVSRPDTTTIYTVIGYDSLNCFHDTSYVTLTVFPIPKVNIIEDKINLIVGNGVALHSTASPDVINWRWSPDVALNCTNCPNPVASPKNDQTYQLLVTNAGGCEARDKVDIFVICSGDNIYVPNTFSPNGDGMNDLFYPRGKGVFSVRSMQVFNRWGEVVYEKTNFNTNDASAGWNGTYKGKILTPDVYVYTIEVVCENNAIMTLKGNVTLLK